MHSYVLTFVKEKKLTRGPMAEEENRQEYIGSPAVNYIYTLIKYKLFRTNI